MTFCLVLRRRRAAEEEEGGGFSREDLAVVDLAVEDLALEPELPCLEYFFFSFADLTGGGPDMAATEGGAVGLTRRGW